MSLNGRKVKRVLVMVEHADEESAGEAEIYDLTELVEQGRIAGGDRYSGSIDLRVRSNKSYSKDHPESELEISWSTDFGEFSPSCARLTDAVNFGMKDNFTVENLRKRAKKIHTAAEKVEHDARQAKLEQVAAVRAQHPIAVVSKTDRVLAEAAKLEGGAGA